MSALQSEMRDILQARRTGSDAKWAARSWHPVPAFIQPCKVSGQSMKDIVMSSSRLRHIIYQMSEDDNVPRQELYRRVHQMLDEIGYNRELPVLRWLGLFTSKILKKLCSAIYINEEALLKVKRSMGRNPVIFVPTHKSYGDFILMSFICFYYELDIPRIAAGMDFQGMAFMGEILRDSCAFFMRRSFAHDKLYSATFSEYVQTLITHGDGAVEFFIEGTRSRTAKSLMPKFGFLAMALKPYLTALVPDISIVPVNICYERSLEEKLFCYELLGVPKPKESTKGFFKAMSILKENYGSVYITVGEPISVAERLDGSIDRSLHSFGPALLQDVTSEESRQMVRLAHSIIESQRQLTVLTCFNVIGAVLNKCILHFDDTITMDFLVGEVKWLTEVLRVCGASVDVNDDSVSKSVLAAVDLQKAVVNVRGNEVGLQPCAHQTVCVSRGRGCDVTSSTMNVALPFMLLQHYVNPCSQYLVLISFLVFAFKSSSQPVTPVTLLKKFGWLYQIFSHEFVFFSENEDHDFKLASETSENLDLVHVGSREVTLGENNKLIAYCVSFLGPFLPAYLAIAESLGETAIPSISETDLLKLAQGRVQKYILEGPACHPANLSLDTLNNGIQAFCVMNCLKKTKMNGRVVYSINKNPVAEILANLGELVSVLHPRRLSNPVLTAKL